MYRYIFVLPSRQALWILGHASHEALELWDPDTLEMPTKQTRPGRWDRSTVSWSSPWVTMGTVEVRTRRWNWSAAKVGALEHIQMGGLVFGVWIHLIGHSSGTKYRLLIWVVQATLRNQERNSHATHGSWFDWVNRDGAVVLLQTAHRKVPFSWLIQHHSLGSLLLLSRVATPKILLCCDIFSRGSAIHGRQIVASRPSSCLQRNWHAMNTYRCSRYELRKNQTSVRNSFVRACHRCYMLGRLQIKGIV